MEKGKRSYQKPQIKEVKLVPEEAVLLNCKAVTGANRAAPKCRSVSACTNLAAGS